MRGSIHNRYKGSYSIVIDIGRDPKTGKRRQKWHTHRGTLRSAERKLADLLRDAHDGTFIEKNKVTVGEWLAQWYEDSKRAFRVGTVRTYDSAIRTHLVPNLGTIPLQALRAGDIRRYGLERAEKGLAPATVALHRIILSTALKAALRDGLVARNVASLVDGLPKRPSTQESAKACWSASEARAFLAAAEETAAQPAALFALLLDTGMRRNEALGLAWADVDLDKALVTVHRQFVDLEKGQPRFGPTKTGDTRRIDVADDTVRLLRAHRREQAELKMRNRKTYADHDLVFARTWEDGYGRVNGRLLGLPLCVHTPKRDLDRIAGAAGVRPVKLHALRHTCASLLLAAGTPVKSVSERLGHKKAMMTLDTYAHVLPGAQQEAARTLAGLLYAKANS